MLTSLFSNRLFQGGLVFFVLFVGGGLLYLSHVKRQTQESLARTREHIKQWEAQQQQNANPPVTETRQGGHTHADGTWHAEPHEPVEPLEPETSISKTGVKLSGVQMPEGTTDPDVIAAWERLDYIAKNPFQWGGRPSARALELMDELTPMWVSDDPHDHGEELMMTLDILAEERDPRSAELLLMYQLDSGVSGRPIDEALVAMGPAAVPALIARLNPEDTVEVFFGPIIRDVVVPIVEQHRSELDGIVEHIILPRLEAIASIGTSDTWDGHERGNSVRSRRALSRLQNTENPPREKD